MWHHFSSVICGQGKPRVVHGGLLIWLDHARLFRSRGRVTVWRWRSGNDQRITEALWEEGRTKKAHNYRGQYVITVNCLLFAGTGLAFHCLNPYFILFFHFPTFPTPSVCYPLSVCLYSLWKPISLILVSFLTFISFFREIFWKPSIDITSVYTLNQLSKVLLLILYLFTWKYGRIVKVNSLILVRNTLFLNLHFQAMFGSTLIETIDWFSHRFSCVRNWVLKVKA